MTQPVTENDLTRGQIRLPRAAKRFFPSELSELEVVILGRRVPALYDPQLGPDRERSEVLRLGQALREAVSAGERLTIRAGIGGVVIIERTSS